MEQQLVLFSQERPREPLWGVEFNTSHPAWEVFRRARLDGKTEMDETEAVFVERLRALTEEKYKEPWNWKIDGSTLGFEVRICLESEVEGWIWCLGDDPLVGEGPLWMTEYERPFVEDLVALATDVWPEADPLAAFVRLT